MAERLKPKGLSKAAESEAAVLFTTYQWGKPQLPCSKGLGENAEGARIPY